VRNLTELSSILTSDCGAGSRLHDGKLRITATSSL
jgi:hypothetical protein